jgi:hypothetical protein
MLETLTTGLMHGWGIAHRMQQVLKDVLQIGIGISVSGPVPTRIQRMNQARLGQFGEQSTGKVYSLSRALPKQLETELEDWDRLLAATALGAPADSLVTVMICEWMSRLRFLLRRICSHPGAGVRWTSSFNFILSRQCQ